MTEKEQIIQAVTGFSAEMLNRMLEKYDTGHRGWTDEERVSSRKLKAPCETI